MFEDYLRVMRVMRVIHVVHTYHIHIHTHMIHRVLRGLNDFRSVSIQKESKTMKIKRVIEGYYRRGETN